VSFNLTEGMLSLHFATDDTIDTIDDLRWKTDRQAGSLI